MDNNQIKTRNIPQKVRPVETTCNKLFSEPSKFNNKSDFSETSKAKIEKTDVMDLMTSDHLQIVPEVFVPQFERNVEAELITSTVDAAHLDTNFLLATLAFYNNKLWEIRCSKN